MVEAWIVKSDHKHSALERTALAHPGFAHIERGVLLGHVKGEVSSALRASRRAAPWADPPERLDGLSVFPHVFTGLAILLGVHCCLCGSTRQGGLFPTSVGFCKWLCGEYFEASAPAFDASDMFVRTHPLCTSCNSKVLCFSREHNGTRMGKSGQPIVTDEQMPALLCSYFHDGAFRRRVRDNADNWSRLRFDPRIGRKVAP